MLYELFGLFVTEIISLTEIAPVTEMGPLSPKAPRIYIFIVQDYESATGKFTSYKCCYISNIKHHI